MNVDIAFALQSQQPIPADHAYPLYGAVSRLVPEVHAENGIAIHPIAGRQVGGRRLMLMPWSALTFRVAEEQIRPLLKLAGKALRIADAMLRLGVPTVHALSPAEALRSRLVIIKVKDTSAADLDADAFAASARRQLDALEISNDARIVIPVRRDGQPRRRTLRLKHREIVGYEVIVEGLSDEESVTLQTSGIGGRRHMGAGVFMPHTATEHNDGT